MLIPFSLTTIDLDLHPNTMIWLVSSKFPFLSGPMAMERNDNRRRCMHCLAFVEKNTHLYVLHVQRCSRFDNALEAEDDQDGELVAFGNTSEDDVVEIVQENPDLRNLNNGTISAFLKILKLLIENVKFRSSATGVCSSQFLLAFNR